MAVINPVFGKELKKYGAFDFNACYNCGNCTAICSLSTEEDSFPRDMVRMSVLGLEGEIRSSLKPWLCYYCGECSTHCPQEANPGELMMSLRRWLTAQYDWTKLSGLLYRYLPATVLAFIAVAAAVVIMGFRESFNLESMMHIGHTFEAAAIISVFSIILIPNIIRMWWFIILKPGTRVSLKRYFIALKELMIHMFTQKNTLSCSEEWLRWFEHFILVIGYLTLLITTVVFDWFSSDNLLIIIAGYVESGVILIITAHFIISRTRKNKEINKFSQPSDWLFVIWLSLMGFTAFAVRLFIDLGIIYDNTWLYIVHLIILAQWALIIVPFGKWTHFLYRSFAMYFSKLRNE